MPTVPLNLRKTRLLDRLVMPAIALVVLLGVIVIVGWITKSPLLMQIAPSWVPMQFNTALLFVATGSAAILLFLRKYRIAIPLAILVALLASLTLCQYAFGISFGIDEALFTAHTTVKTSHPGRMAPNTAISFILCAVMIMAYRQSSANRVLVVFLSTCVFCLAALAIYGYLTGTESTYGWGNYTRMAIHTATGFAVLGGSFLIDSWYAERTLPEKHNRIPAWLSLVSTLVALTIGLSIWNTVSSLENRSALEETKLRGKSIRTQLHSVFDSVRLSLKQMVRRYEGGIRGPNWVEDAEEHIRTTPGLFAITFLRDDDSIRRINLKNEGMRHLVEEWVTDDTPAKLKFANLEESGSSFHYFVISLRVENSEPFKDSGYLEAFFDAREFFSHALHPIVEDERYVIYDTNGATIISTIGNEKETKGLESIHIEDTYHGWYGEVLEIERASLTALGVTLSSMALVATFLIGGLVFWSSTFAINSYNRDQERSDSELFRTNTELETLLHTISHDLREPIRTVNSFSSLLEEECRDCLNEDSRHVLDRLKGGAARLEELLSDIATISRLHHLEMSQEKTSLKSLVESQLKHLHKEIESTGAKIEVSEKLPSILVEKKSAQQAVHHLIGNALKFSKNGSPPEISIHPYRDKKRKGIVIKDRGIGIQPPMDERLFQLFRRGVGREIEGTGLGLAIVRKVAEKHGGEVWFRNRTGGGTAFYLVLTSPKP